jgi:hypothetical protein
LAATHPTSTNADDPQESRCADVSRAKLKKSFTALVNAQPHTPPRRMPVRPTAWLASTKAA